MLPKFGKLRYIMSNFTWCNVIQQIKKVSSYPKQISPKLKLHFNFKKLLPKALKVADHFGRYSWRLLTPMNVTKDVQKDVSETIFDRLDSSF